MKANESSRNRELVVEEVDDITPEEFDRDVTFEEVFMNSLGQEFMKGLSTLLTIDFLVTGRGGKTAPIPPTAHDLLFLPRPSEKVLHTKPVRIKGSKGASSVGIPIFHEGGPFAMLIVADKAVEDREQMRRLRIAAKMIEWYIHVIQQQRMISELHDQTQKSSFGELIKEHQRVLESEKKYRELAETLEQRVKERKEELEKAQRQLIQQEKLASIGQLAAGVAHEINNPTGFVNSNLQTLKKYHGKMIEMLKISRDIFETDKAPRAEEFLDGWKRLDMDYVFEDLPAIVEESLRGTGRIIRIVNGLSRFSHMDQDEWGLVNINELLDSAVDLLANEIKHKAELIKDYDDLPKIRGNSNQLGQVFVNLILNALQSMDKSGKLTLITRFSDLDITILVKDNGKGISSENLSKIFDPFFTTKPAGQGTGLGLSVSYEIVAGHEGDIQVESEPGKGTTFHVRLPIDPGKED